MIIWLASYPRSGNTLFRTICRHCFGIYSYADEPVDYESDFRSNPDLIGHRDYPEEWDQFYHNASKSSEIYLVKTHRPPVDEQPYIYIVRDGRSAITSYQKFNKYFNNIEMSRVELTLGVGGYGNWSTHYYQWNNRDGIKNIVLRFEDLVDVSDEKLLSLADFLSYTKKPVSWVNPLEELKKVEPGFFDGQKKAFAGDEKWTPTHEFLFAKIHGELMFRLGYYDEIKSSGHNAVFSQHTDIHISDQASEMVSEMVSYIARLQQENLILSQACNERLALINKLNSICDERLQLINRLNKNTEQ